MKKILLLFKNKYFLVVLVFLVWMTFFDKNDFLSQYEYSGQLQKLQQEKEFYTQQNAVISKDLRELSTDLNTAEKFAREKYYMKKDNEDVFVIVTDSTLAKK